VNPRFIGKVVVVIGGNSGIGLSAAKAFAGEGARVVLTGRNPETLRTAGEEIGPAALPMQSDVADLRQIDALMREIQSRYGNRRIHPD